MVGTNKDEMAFFYWERKQNDIFTLTDDGLKTRLDQEFGENAEKILSKPIARAGPAASPADLTLRLATARAMWLGSIEIAEKKYEQKAARVYMYMFTHASNLIVPGTNHRLGAAHATEIWYKFDNVNVEGSKDPKDPPARGLSALIPIAKKLR